MLKRFNEFQIGELVGLVVCLFFNSKASWLEPEFKLEYYQE